MTDYTSTPTETSAASPPRNYKHLAREILAATRRLDFTPNEERLICLVLEFSYLHKPGRDAGIFYEQNHLARLRSMNKARVSQTLDALVAAKVIERKGAVIGFLPPRGWKRRSRNERNPEEQLSLEDWLRSVHFQETLNLFELDNALVQTWLEDGSEPAVAEKATQQRFAATVPLAAVAKKATGESPLYNVCLNGVPTKERSTANGLCQGNGNPRKERLEQLRSFFAETDGQAEADEELTFERSLSFWSGLVTHEWDQLETEMGEIKMRERGGYTSGSRIKRLTHLMTESVGLGSTRWKKCFPGRQLSR